MAARCGLFFVLGALLLPLALSDIPGDLIQSLPGWVGDLPTKQYSGYITVNAATGKHLHYWFVESVNEPKTDPVVLWLNGGPGCSSLLGYLTEHGPIQFDPASVHNQSIPKLVYNNYTWTNVANIIYLEAPVGVGFSYSDTPSVDYHMDDNSTALDNYQFLVKWFQGFPEYKNNDFYVTGESYGGIYVPTLVDTIRIKNTQTLADRINLKGFMVGNGCIGEKVGACSLEDGVQIHADFYHNHALYPDQLYSKLITTCGPEFKNLSETCFDLLTEMSQDIGGVNIYDIYQPCVMNMLSQKSGRNRRPYARQPLKELLVQKYGRYGGPDECIDDENARFYLDQANVREALHVASVAKIGGWMACTSKIKYDRSTASLLPIYPTLINTYRTLIYNGDVDGCVPYNGNEHWTSGLGFTIKDGWRPWIVDDQVAGYVTEYDANGFQFVTVKGAGHMVPQFKPKQALAMFQRYIMGKTL